MSIENRLQLLETKAKQPQQEVLVFFRCVVDCIDGKPVSIPSTCWRCLDHRIFILPDESAVDFQARAEATFKPLCNPGFALVIYQDIFDEY